MGTECSLFISLGVACLMMSFCIECSQQSRTDNTNTQHVMESITADRFGCSLGYRWLSSEKRCEVCSNWTYGKSCHETCSCVRNNTRVCGHITGTCLCHPQWTGITCSVPMELKREKRQDDENNLVPENVSACPAWYFGLNCTEMCSCNQTTTVNCNSTNGVCNCGPGYTGSQCNQECVNGTFGENCSQSCTCDPINSLACNHVDGTCDCSAGWNGTYCNETCSETTYGYQCKSNCSCPTNASPACNHINGTCSCITGYYIVGDACIKIDTATVSPQSVSAFLAVFENPVYVCIITAGCILLLVAIILCILWKICRCSCAEVKNRKHRLGGPKQLMNTPTETTNKHAIAALANITTKSIKQEEELDVPTSAVYGGTLDVTGKPPVSDSFNINGPLQSSFPSIAPLSGFAASQGNLTNTLLNGTAYYKNMKSSSVSTFKLNEDQREDSRTDISLNPYGDLYQNNVNALPLQAFNRKLVSSQPNISRPPRNKDVTFDDVIADLSKKKLQNRKTNLKKMNSRSLPNINRGHLDVISKRTPATPLPFKYNRSNPNIEQTKQGSAVSIYDDTAVTGSIKSLNATMTVNKPTLHGAKNAVRIVPIPVAPPVVNFKNQVTPSPPPPPASNKYGSVIAVTPSISANSPYNPPPPLVSKIPSSTQIYRSDMRKDDTNMKIPAAEPHFQNMPSMPPVANIPKQRTADVSGIGKPVTNKGQYDDTAVKSLQKQQSEDIYDKIGQGVGNPYEDTAVKALERQPTEGIYDDIDQMQDPNISRPDRFASGVYAELE